MSKQCSVCNTINHSSANHCTNCGVELPDKELSLEDSLKIELHEAKKDLKFYKSSLEESSKKIEELNQKSKIIVSLEKELNSQKIEIVDRDKQLIELKTKISSNHKSLNSYKVRFYLTLTISIITIIILFTGYQYQIDERKRTEQELLVLKNSNDQQTISTPTENNNNYEHTISKLNSEIATLKKLVPQEYKVIETAYIFNKSDGEQLNETGNYYEVNTVLSIYSEKEGYGLADAGWVDMSNLEVINQ